MGTQVRIFLRDSMTCVYCRRRTVFLPSLQMLSKVLPAALPFADDWSGSATHAAYWDITASIEHIIPATRLGRAANVDHNLACACSRCQYQKGERLLRELGWEDPMRVSSDWTGALASIRDWSARLRNCICQ